MNMFCPTCEDYREARTIEGEETYTVRGSEVTVPVTLEVCEVCGAPICQACDHLKEARRCQEHAVAKR